MPPSQEVGKDSAQDGKGKGAKRNSRPKDQGRDIQKQREFQYQSGFEGQLPNNTFQKLFQHVDQFSPDTAIERDEMTKRRGKMQQMNNTIDDSMMNQSDADNFDNQQRKTIMKNES